jgi:glutathione synthase/RimK-type ligase-like ATP-grasp enzyme
MSLPIPRATSILLKCAKELGIQAQIVDRRYKYLIQLSKGLRVLPIQSNFFTLNSAYTHWVARDKVYAYLLLKRRGVPVPQFEYFFVSNIFSSKEYYHDHTISDALKYARNCLVGKGNAYIVIKPAHQYRGIGVAKVGNAKHAKQALIDIKECGDYIAIIQQYVEGREYRLVAVDSQITVCYEKIYSPYDDDIKPIGIKPVSMRSVHPSYIKWVNLISKCLALRFVGLDIRCHNITQPATKFFVREANSAPWLVDYFYLSPEARRAVIETYKLVLTAMFSESFN